MIDQVGMIFIHGAGLGSYIWRDLEPKLHALPLMIDLPNRNGRPKANAQLSLQDYVAAVVSAVDQAAPEKLVIVAHSVGGLIGLKVAEHFSARVIGFVGIGAAIPSSGCSFASCFPFPQKYVLPILLRLAGTKPPESTIRQNLCHDLSESQTQQVIDNFTPESSRLFTEAIHYTLPHADKLYISLSDDRELPLTVQNRMADNLQSDEAMQLNSGHMPMLRSPNQLATALNEFTEQCAESH